VIDAGRDSFAAPGFIDALGHLGLEGDRSSPGPEISMATIVGAAGTGELRVARAGVTTVILAPYRAASQGSQLIAVRTAGRSRENRIVRDPAGVFFELRGADPGVIAEQLDKRLEAAKKYREKWQEYEKALAEWKEKLTRGESVSAENAKEKSAEPSTPDPITGTWSVVVSGGPIPEPASGTMRLRLEGSDIEGRILVPGAEEEAKIVATFDGKHISGEIQIDTDGLGYPRIEADLVGEDHIVGVIAFQDLEIDLDAKRTDKEPVEFRVAHRRTRGKDGRPLPPKVDDALEPLRAALEGTIPLVVGARSAAQITAVLEAASKYEVSVVMVGAEDAAAVAERLTADGVGVIVPRQIVQPRNRKPYHQADDLSRRGVQVAFQSEAEDGARSLPQLAIHAVERGMSADAALAALTVHASTMFNLQEEIGTLEEGRRGDIVIFSGHPLAGGSRIMHVIINGEEVP